MGAAKISVPAPALVKPPVPPMVWPMPNWNPLVSIVPPPAFNVIGRNRFPAAPTSCSVPPLKVSVSPAVPRLLSLEIASVPWLIVHGVAWPGVPVSVQVPVPVFWNTPKFWN